MSDASKAPIPCPEMADIRAHIDSLDGEIIALLAKRQYWVHQAGLVKPQRDDVIDEARIEEVMTHILQAAEKCGLAPEIAEPLWRQLIELSIAYEFQVFDGRD